jgi:hypothetical protein
MHEIQWLIYDATIFLSLIYKKVERRLHVDVYKEDTHKKYDFQASETHIVVIVIFEAKKITRKEHEK